MLPSILTNFLETKHSIRIESMTPLSGGCINQATCIDTRQGKYCLKWNANAPSAMFSSEAHGLALIRATRTIRIPDVVAVSDPSQSEFPGFILLEWIEPSYHGSFDMAALGESLAKLHLSARGSQQSFGLEIDNYIGLTPQPNAWSASWTSFFRDQRLGYQTQLATKNRRLTQTRQKRLDRLINCLERLLPERTDLQPSLLHGDLWSGNVISDSVGMPVLIDPAVYYGDREAEIAYTELFGGFSPVFYAAYQSIFPLDPEYKDRRDLYNLYHLLNHLNLFGEMYAPEVDRILTHYVG